MRPTVYGKERAGKMEIKSTEFFRNMKKLPPPGTEEFRQLIDWETQKILGESPSGECISRGGSIGILTIGTSGLTVLTNGGMT